jgi:hypothetical protein
MLKPKIRQKLYDDARAFFRPGTPGFAAMNAAVDKLERAQLPQPAPRDRSYVLLEFLLTDTADTLTDCLNHGRIADAHAAVAELRSIARVLGTAGIQEGS